MAAAAVRNQQEEPPQAIRAALGRVLQDLHCKVVRKQVLTQWAAAAVAVTLVVALVFTRRLILLQVAVVDPAISMLLMCPLEH